MTDCLFCKMVAGEIKPELIYEDEKVLAFKDINPQAPVHFLVIPKAHVATLNELADRDLAGYLLLTAAQLAQQQGLGDDGYRTLINCNRHGGQAVYHIHVHVLGGRQMHWPPG